MCLCHFTHQWAHEQKTMKKIKIISANRIDFDFFFFCTPISWHWICKVDRIISDVSAWPLAKDGSGNRKKKANKQKRNRIDREKTTKIYVCDRLNDHFWKHRFRQFSILFFFFCSRVSDGDFVWKRFRKEMTARTNERCIKLSSKAFSLSRLFLDFFRTFIRKWSETFASIRQIRLT